jgi:glycerol-3-phosphate dehydrogenase (NAD(P)+)
VSEILFLGGGAWGTTLAKLARVNGHTVKLWSRSQELPLAKAVLDVDIIVSCLPMSAVASVASKLAQLDVSEQTILLSTTKGLDPETAKPPSACWLQLFPQHPLVILSGPNLASEICQGLPTATVVASADPQAAQQVQAYFSSERFRVYTASDWRGVELGGVLKNVIAIAAGISDGLGLGSNARSALMTRGLAEMIQVGCYWGAQSETFFGLSGMGDLLATCHSNLSRNYQIGFALGSGKTLQQALEALRGTAEGIYTAPILMHYARSVGLDVPITAQVCAVLEGTSPPIQAFAALMNRRLRGESPS